MSGKNAEEIRIAKDGAINLAPVGTELPDGSSAGDVTVDLDAAFVDAGYASEDGVALAVTPEILEVKVWQARTAVRRDLIAQAVRNTFALSQFNGENVSYAFGGGALSEPSANLFRYDFPEEGDSLDERSLVIDWVDGDFNYRFVVPRGNVVEAVETSLIRSGPMLLPISHDALEPEDGGLAYILTDDPAFGESS